MKVIVIGQSEYDKYEVFKKAITAAIEDIDKNDSNFHIYGLGSKKINAFGQEFSNITEDYLRGKGVNINFIRMPTKEARNRLLDNDISKVLYFGKRSEHSDIVKIAELQDVDVRVYKY